MRAGFIVLFAATTSACAVSPKTEAQLEAERVERWEARYDAQAADECRQTPDIEQKRACLDRVRYNRAVWKAPSL